MNQALDPTQSFIVQAPAGSGKTELLTQRFLRLLSHNVQSPEEIIAITFTRKAASEMRQRILNALSLAEHDEPPEAAHKKITWQLARDVLQCDEKYNWQLQTNPNRLRILTIDALCASLCAQIPLLAQCGARPAIADQPEQLYQIAVQRLLTHLHENPSWQDAFQILLMHLDNRVYQLEKLLIDMLGKREQWLPHIMGPEHTSNELRSSLEEALQHITVESLENTAALFDDALQELLLPLLNFAAQQCRTQNIESPITACLDIQTFPENNIDHLKKWDGIVQILLTQTGSWRKQVNKNIGFPAASAAPSKAEKQIYTEYKKQMGALINSMSDNDGLLAALVELQQRPPLHYDDRQWSLIDAFTKILPVLAAELMVVFTQHNCIDFIELNLAAARALGDSEQPTDLALHLDAKINHLLVDEFQDTSIQQFSLLEKLVAGWESEDGRTLFLVGDPMQSIYRFRNAEVGLFLRAQQFGLGNVSLIPLQLHHNYRSQARVLEWINAAFSDIFPTTPNISSGAIHYTPAIPAADDDKGDVQLYPFIDDDASAEAKGIATLITKLKSQSPESSIAILVRSRTHLQFILPALANNNIAYQAIDIDPLYYCSEIQDLVTLTKALHHRGERTSWLAFLRAPWCGLTLQDLHVVASAANNTTIYGALEQLETLTELSDDGLKRLQCIIPILLEAFSQQGRSSLADWIKRTWLALGGPSLLKNQNQLDNCNVYFRLLERIDLSEMHISVTELQRQLNKLYAQPNNKDNNAVQVMTIHKSKGLEFDHVILPGLNYKSPPDASQLMMWLERPSQSGDSDLILAPIKSTAAKNDPLYHYLRRIQKQKADYETARLLYVATTRARESLHLTCTLTCAEDGEYISPAKNSFLHLLWNYFQNSTPADYDEDSPEKIPQRDPNQLVRITTDWNTTVTQHISSSSSDSNHPSPRDTHQQALRHTGTLIHEILAQIADTDLSSWQQRLETLQPTWQRRLQSLGVIRDHIDECLAIVMQAIKQTLNDPQGQWILAPHNDAHCEYPLTAVIEDRTQHIVIDRCFIDEDGIRWIIDYKTTIKPDDLDDETFWEQQRIAHRAQLELYERILRLTDDREIETALYFPMQQTLLETRCITPTRI